MLATLTMAPPRAPATICLAAACVATSIDIRLMSTCLRMLRSLCSRKGRAETPPALLTRMRSEEHTSELQSLMRISYAVFCLKKKKQQHSTPAQADKTYKNLLL